MFKRFMCRRSMGLAFLLLVATAGAPRVSANDNTPRVKRTGVNHFSVSVKMVSSSGRVQTVKVGDVTRSADGTVVATGVAAPGLDKMADEFVRRWKRYRAPAKVVITEEIYSDSGMRPSLDKHSFTFTSADPLYKAAVIRKFVEDSGYETLGLSSIKFVEFDSEASRAKNEIIHDEPLKNYNFRKGTSISYYKGRAQIIIYAHVRPANNGSPQSVFRPSTSKPTLAIAQNHDDGNQEIGRLILHDDGRIEVAPSYARDVFESDFGKFENSASGVEVSVIENESTWKHLKVGKGSPLLFEAWVVEILEHSNFYRVAPLVDPMIFAGQ